MTMAFVLVIEETMQASMLDQETPELGVSALFSQYERASRHVRTALTRLGHVYAYSTTNDSYYLLL